MEETLQAKTTRFIVGKTYYMTSIGDHNCRWECKVLRRTAKTVWLTDPEKPKTGEPIKRRIYIWEGVESVNPFGRYSFSPILRATRNAEGGE